MIISVYVYIPCTISCGIIYMWEISALILSKLPVYIFNNTYMIFKVIWSISTKHDDSTTRTLSVIHKQSNMADDVSVSGLTTQPGNLTEAERILVIALLTVLSILIVCLVTLIAITCRRNMKSEWVLGYCLKSSRGIFPLMDLLCSIHCLIAPYSKIRSLLRSTFVVLVLQEVSLNILND